MDRQMLVLPGDYDELRRYKAETMTLADDCRREIDRLTTELAAAKKSNEWLRSDRHIACVDGCQKKQS